jgi:hypothetical protein
VLWPGSGRHEDQLQTLTTLGFSAFDVDQNLYRDRKDSIPDTIGLKTKQVEALPLYLKYFKCSGALEKNECDEGHKYSEQCPKRQGKASWHPGL